MLMDNPACAILIPLKNLRCAPEWHLNLDTASVGKSSNHGKVEGIRRNCQVR